MPDQLRPDQLHLYVDAEIETQSGTRATKAFGPFRTHATAEIGLTVLMARENVLGAIIRNPNA